MVLSAVNIFIPEVCPGLVWEGGDRLDVYGITLILTLALSVFFGVNDVYY